MIHAHQRQHVGNLPGVGAHDVGRDAGGWQGDDGRRAMATADGAAVAQAAQEGTPAAHGDGMVFMVFAVEMMESYGVWATVRPIWRVRAGTPVPKVGWSCSSNSLSRLTHALAPPPPRARLPLRCPLAAGLDFRLFRTSIYDAPPGSTSTLSPVPKRAVSKACAMSGRPKRCETSDTRSMRPSQATAARKSSAPWTP